MKKILKKLVIMSILVALLGQNVSVLAVNTAYEVSQARKIATEQMANSGNSSEGQSSSGETESDGTSSNGENGGERNATHGKTRSGEPEESSKSGNKLNIEIDLRLPIESPIFTVKLDGENVKIR